MINGHRVRQTTRLVALAAVAAVTGSTTSAQPPPAAIAEEAIVVRDMTGLDTEFSFSNTIGAILRSAGLPDTQADKEAFVKTMLASFTATSQTNPHSGVPMAVDARRREAALNPADMLNAASPAGLVPIGLFNRLDLASEGWTDCGEHRIVFSSKSQNAPNSRFFLIFEARLPNPGSGMAGCLPVAERWRDIGAATQAARAPLLKELYFDGLPGFTPVVHHLNFGGQLGQVRANMFVRRTKWQLREFRVLATDPGQLAFAVGPVQKNPLAEYYKSKTLPAAQQPERARFQAAFVATYADALRRFDANAPATMSAVEYREGLISCLGAPIDPRDNEFQSDSQGSKDVPASKAGKAFKRTLDASWTSPIGNRTVSRTELLNRAGAITCGGCHQFAAGDPIGRAGGQTLSWPTPKPGSAGDRFFVHISERTQGGKHEISDTLQNVFIPHRKKVLASILDPADGDPGRHCLVGVAPPPPPAAATRASPPPSWAAAREAAEQVLRPGPGARTTLAAGESPAQRVRKLSDEAHAIDQVTPGATVTFRSTH